MKNINLTTKEYSKLKTKENIIANGFEGFIVEYFDNELVYLKIFNDFFKPNDLEKRLMYLYKLEYLNIITTPLKTVTVNKELVGYSMQPYHTSLYEQKFLFSDKLKILFKVKNALELLHQNGVIYGDITSSNILTNGIDIKFCDICNTKIDNMNFNIKTPHINKYLSKNNKIDEKLDNYVFNLFTLAYFSGKNIPVDECYVRDILNNDKIPSYYKKKHATKILEETLIIDKNYSGDYLIDSIKNKYKSK